MLAMLNTDGTTITPIKATPSTHRLDVADGTSGSDAGRDTSAHDDNQRTTLLATDANGVIVTLWANSSGALLIKSS